MYESFPNDSLERSYGIIPLRITLTGTFEVLTIQHKSTGEFGFPKGHAEPGDSTPLAAAKRELLEETGVSTVSLIFNPYRQYFETSYINPRTGKRKVVVVWVAEISRNAKVTIQPEEIQSYKFVDIHEAHTILSFKEDRETLLKVIEGLKAAQNQAEYPKMLLLGDSITQWSWQPGGLAQRLQDWYQRRLDILVRGFSGYNSSWAMNVLPHIFPKVPELQVKSLEVVTIWLGTNDSVPMGEAQHIPVYQYEENLRKMVAYIQMIHPSVRIILFTPPAVSPPFRQRELTVRYADMVKKLAQELGLPCLDCFHEMEAEAKRVAGGDLYEGLKTFLVDGVHLTPAGYELVFARLKAIITESLPDLVPSNLAIEFPPHALINKETQDTSFSYIKYFDQAIV